MGMPMKSMMDAVKEMRLSVNQNIPVIRNKMEMLTRLAQKFDDTCFPLYGRIERQVKDIIDLNHQLEGTAPHVQSGKVFR